MTSLTLSTARDRYNAANSLLCLLQALEGRIAVIELRNEMVVKGCVVQVDGFMNVNLKDAVVQGNNGLEYRFDEFFIKARNIRYVQIPDDMNILEAMRDQIYGKSRHRAADMTSTTKAKLARKRQKELLKQLQKAGEEAKEKQIAEGAILPISSVEENKDRKV